MKKHVIQLDLGTTIEIKSDLTFKQTEKMCFDYWSNYYDKGMEIESYFYDRGYNVEVVEEY